MDDERDPNRTGGSSVADVLFEMRTGEAVADCIETLRILWSSHTGRAPTVAELAAIFARALGGTVPQERRDG